LANLYLHYVFDLWVDQWRRRHATGDVIVVRYADDSVLGFQHHHEAVAFQQALEVRLAQFGLSLHPQKTHLLRFGRFAIRDAQVAGEGKPGSFDFLGFTHLCSHNSLNKFTIRRRTMRKRRVAQLKRIRGELRRRLHDPIARTGAWLQRVVRGHINYYGVPLNSQTVAGFCHEVRKSWYRSLCRRSQRKRLDWQRFGRIAAYWLPPPRVVHPYPQQRFDAKTRGRSRMR
jgi:RNA-directed DNA polymerase